MRLEELLRSFCVLHTWSLWKTWHIFLNLKMSKKIKKKSIFHLFIHLFAQLAELKVQIYLPSFPYWIPAEFSTAWSNHDNGSTGCYGEKQLG